MRLTSLSVDRLPGIERPLNLELAAGVNVIVGPNASGKSSLVRALLALLYPHEHEGVVDVRAEFVSGEGAVLRAHRLGQDVGWERDGRSAPPPALPPYHLVGAYSIRLEDLVAAERVAEVTPRRRGRAGSRTADLGSVDHAIAAVIGTALSGGVDLEAVRRGIGSQQEAGLRLAKAVRDASAERSRLTDARSALRAREDTLPTQEDELRVARERARRAQSVADAQALVEAVREVEAARAELAELPHGLEDLRGGEYDTLLEHDDELANETRRAEEVARASESLRQAVEAVGFDQRLTRPAVDLQVERAARLVSNAQELDRKSAELGALKARKRELERRLGATPNRDTATAALVDDALLERVELLVETRQAASSDLDALERHRSRLEADADAEPPVDAPVEQLARLRADLLRWLATPPDALRRPAWAWGLSLALTVAAAVTAGLDGGTTLPLVLGGCAVLWLVVMGAAVRTPAEASRRRIEAEVLRTVAGLGHVPGSGITDPLTWDHRSVADRVVAIDRALADHARLQAERERRASALRSVAVDLSAARERRDEAQAQLDAVRAEHGFTVGSQLRLAVWLQATRELAGVETELGAVHASGSRLYDTVTREAAALKRYLVEAGAVTAAAVESLDHLQLKGALAELARRVSHRDADALARAGLERERERAHDALTRLAADRARLLEGANVPDDDDAPWELKRRVELLPTWQAASARLRKAEASVKHLQQRLAADTELLAAATSGDEATLDRLARECSDAGTRAEELVTSISQTRDAIERAASDRSIERATARVAAAVEELAAHRDEALRLGAARFLLERVEAEHRAEARPPELERAAALFERFTRGALTLHLDESAPTRAALAAVDAHGRLLSLDRLSTGTRAQLLIASRLAFALEAEARGMTLLEPGTQAMGLPFVLDEALTTSDPERFAAIAAALLDVSADEGRQVIYLSARQDDADLWQRAAALNGSSIDVVQLGSHGVGNAASPAAS